jgi:branched-chain amino acid transport system permease protein
MLQATTNGLVLGGAYALVAIGFVLLFNNTQFFNFAHGDFVTIGGYLEYTLVKHAHLPWPLMVILVMFSLGVIGLATELLTRRLVRRRQLLVGAIATLGLGLVIRASLNLIYGSTPEAVRPLIDGKSVHILGAALSYQQLIIVGVALVVLATMYCIYQYTFIGLVLKATAEDPTAAQIMGVPTARVVKGSFFASAALAGLAGLLLAPIFSASASLGYLIVFTAVVGTMVGGFGSLVGAVVGSLVVGVVQIDAAYLISADYQNIAVYGLLVVLFIVKPTGLFGTRLVEKV